MPGGLHPPQSVIDTWPTPNYINPVTRGYGLLALTVILFIVTPSIVGARLWARIIILRKPGLDDVLICFALIPTIGLGVCFILAAQKFGFDRHIWDVPPTLWLPAAIVGWTIELLYHISTSFIKISILLFYKRMTNATHTIKFMREGYLLWIVSAVEVNGAIICASAPALKPLFDKFFADIPTSIYVRSVKELSWRAGKNRNGSNGRDTPGLSNPNRDSKTMHARANPRISKAESTHELLNVASGQGPPHWPLK
ncbi:hypothetical protein MMC14_000475 [Varicellaria rhodocarpa]|nr:hypothetical protein [Varicellaria rhodocarpa]